MRPGAQYLLGKGQILKGWSLPQIQKSYRNPARLLGWSEPAFHTFSQQAQETMVSVKFETI